MISVVIPTVDGREDLLEQTKQAFRDTAEVEFIVVRNERTCGDAWNMGAERASGQYLMLAGDDLLPQGGWAEVAIEAANANVLPAPRITTPDGKLECCGTLGQGLYIDGKEGAPVYNAPIPFFRLMYWEQIGPAPSIHYYADDYLSYRARFNAGLSIEVRREYSFVHLNGQVGKAQNVARNEEFRWAYAQAVSEL